MGTKNNPGKDDCYDKADPDEPLFVLRAKDPHAPALVWLWASMAEMDGGTDSFKVKEARQCMGQMIEWAHARGIQSHGIGSVALVALSDMIRASNTAMDRIRRQDGYTGPTMQAMTPDAMRLLIAQSQVG